MSTTKTISVSMPPAQIREAERLAKQENRTVSDLFRDAFHKYREQDAKNQALRKRFAAELEALRAEAEQAGANLLTSEEIDAEIRAYRDTKRMRMNKPAN